MDQPNDSREEFEDAMEFLGCGSGGDFERWDDGEYKDETTRVAYIAWQAGIAQKGANNSIRVHVAPNGFYFVDVTTDGYEDYINLFWGEYVLALVPPPASQEIRSVIPPLKKSETDPGPVGEERVCTWVFDHELFQGMNRYRTTCGADHSNWRLPVGERCSCGGIVQEGEAGDER